MRLRPSLTSLRGRYISAALVLLMMLAASVWWANKHVSSTNNSSTIRLKALNQAQQLSLKTRDAVWDADFALYTYLHTPSKDLEHSARDKLLAAIQSVDALAGCQWAQPQQRQDQLSALRTQVVRMHDEALKLMEIRVNREARFPTMKTIVDSLHPASIEFFTATTLAIENLLSNGNKTEEYQLFQDTRRLWGRMIETFRIFLAFRTGMIGDPEKGMSFQISNIELFYQGVQKKLYRLNELSEQGVLSFQGTESLHIMQNVAATWQSHYKEVSAILASEQWRSDDSIIRQRVQPLSVEIRELLRALDAKVAASAADELDILTHLARSLVRNIWLVGGIVLFFGTIGFYYLEWGVLRPISHVARALETRAHDRTGSLLPLPQIRETRDLVAAFNDLTDSLAEAELNREEAEVIARQAAKMSTVGQLASSVAHEINNPLNNMMRVTEFLEQALQGNSLPASVHEDITVLRQEQKRCANIVQSLLAFGRPSPPSLCLVDPLSLLKDSIRLLQRNAENSGVSLEIHTHPGIPEIEVDPSQIQQVIVNLLLNAIQASPRNSSVNIYLECIEKLGLRCRVEDRGSGVKQNEIVHIFEPFYTTKGDQQGIGLGLSVSHSIIDHHGGKTGAYKSSDGAFVVWFSIPCELVANDSHMIGKVSDA